MATLILLHVLLGIAVLAAGRRLGRWALPVVAVAPLATLVWLATNLGRVSERGLGVHAGGPGHGIASHTSWVPTLGLSIDLRVDAFAALMIAIVAGVGALVFAYSWWYFGRSPVVPRVAGLLVMFAGSMLGVVTADHLLVLYLFWELTSITSYLLIGLGGETTESRRAAQHALLVTGLGGLAMLLGFVMIGQAAGTYRLSEILASPPTGGTVPVALALVLVGAMTKSAQFPFHGWLPGAMVAPTPISAYLHSAAMVKAGVYLVARFAPAFALVGTWRPIIVTAGVVTMLFGGVRAARPTDLKQLLAYGTISQLGFLMVLFGIGRPEATAAGCAVLVAHALFKASLFMVVGIVDHETGTRDIDRLPRLGRAWRPTLVVATLSAASMAAVPPLAGFIAKEEAYGSLLDGRAGDRWVLVGIVVGSMLTVVYSLRIVAGLWRAGSGPDATDAEPHAPSVGFVAPAAFLTGLTVLFGIVPAVWSSAIGAAGSALDAGVHVHLALWHGVNTALGLSVLTLAVGYALFRVRDRWAPALAGAMTRRGDRLGYEIVLGRTLTLAGRVTALVQSGSLPTYVAVILATAVIAPAAALTSGAWWHGLPSGAMPATQIAVAVVIVAAALAATIAGRRFVAALLLGVVGYGMAVLFVIQGAPDLALTQFAVETLSVVVFLMVLRALPDRFRRSTPPIGRVGRVALSLAVGAFVAVMAVAFAGPSPDRAVSREMIERAEPDGHGHNIVNVILVDIRGLDTLGEITVLVTAAVGVAALARAGRMRGSRCADR